MRKVLIIKTGRSETLNELRSSSPSLGDIVRHFSFIPHIKEYFQVDHLHWLCDEGSTGLFNLIDEDIRPVFFNDDLDIANYDTIINFEKDPKIINMADKFKEWFGFYQDGKELMVRRIDKTCSKFNFDPSYNKLFEDCMELVFALKKGEVLINSSLKNTPIKNDIGLNWKSGPKWPEKQLDNNMWQGIVDGLGKDYVVSWQEGFSDLSIYLHWISSCRSIITLDSLGLHLAEVLGKNIIALFGPTNEKQIHVSLGRKVKYTSQESMEELTNKIISIIKK